MIFAYVSPEHSTVYDVQNTNGIDILNGKIFDITSAYPHAEILLAGDLNARVRDFCDFIPEDTLDYIFHTCDLSRSGVNLPIWRLPLRPPDEAAKIPIFMNSDFSLLPKAKTCFPITADACFI